MIINETLKTIRRRRSARRFRDNQITHDELMAVIDAGLYAPFAQESSRRLLVIQHADKIRRLNEAAKAVAGQFPGLESIANDPEYHGLYRAPTVILALGDTRNPGHVQDCAACLQNMLLAAESVGLGSCWLYFPVFGFSGPEGDALREEFKVPEHFAPVSAVALGYRDGEIEPCPERSRDGVMWL